MTEEEQDSWQKQREWLQEQYDKEEERIRKIREEEEIEKMALAMTFGVLFGIFD